MRGIENVDFVNDPGIDFNDTVKTPRQFKQFVPQGAPVGIGQLFGIKEARQFREIRQYDCCGNDGPCQGTPSRFVYACNKTKTL